MSVVLSAPPASSPAKPRRRWRKALLLTLVLFALGEITTRIYWCLDRQTPFFSSRTIWYGYYPELRSSGVEDTLIRNDDEIYDILILGGSVISPAFHFDKGEVNRKFEAVLRRPVRIFNLATPAHTSRDSLLKYRALAKQRFDLVILYDSINDTRMNNCPPEMFRADYTHCAWYRQIDRCLHNSFLAHATLPFYAVSLIDRIGQEERFGWCLSQHRVPQKWLHHGADVKTRQAYHDNVEEIVTTAKTKGERVMVMTFAYHIPPDYSLHAFRAKSLDYHEHICPVELWGKPENVAKGMDAHNEVIRALVVRHPHVLFADQQARLPKSRATFDDCCHLTLPGRHAFVDNIVEALVARSQGP